VRGSNPAALGLLLYEARGTQLMGIIDVILSELARKGQSQRDSATRFSTSDFFHELVSLQPLSIPLGLFKIFFENLRNIRFSRGTTGVI
jgi:hypothetical protein